MNTKSVVAALLATVFMAGSSHAITLTNEDDATYQVEVVLGEGDGSTKQFALESGETLADVCTEGCTVRLDNGATQEFGGDETIFVEDGKFVVSE